MLDDLRLSVRLLRRSPMLAIAAVITLTVALGANAAVFSVVDQVLLRGLPVQASDRVVVIWPHERASPSTISEISYATFSAWQGRTRSFEALAAIGSVNWSLILREGDPVTVPIAAVSASFFPLLGTPPALGRTLRPADDQRGAERVAVLSHQAWNRRFGADPRIVGRRLRFSDAVYTVIGVMPEGFDYPRGAEMWVPVVPHLVDASAEWKIDALTVPEWGVLFVLGRLGPGVTIDAAREEMSALMARGGTAFRPGMDASLTPLDDHAFGPTRSALRALAVCVGLVLLIACANVAALLLVRSSARAHEISLRLAIGASRWRIVRQSLADAFLITAVGGLGGLALASWIIHLLVVLAPSGAYLDGAHLDSRALTFAAAISLVTTALVGLGPGLQTSRWNLREALGRGSPQIARSHRLRRAFVAVQVGLALVVLVCAGLVGRSLVNLLRIDVGFNPINVLTVNVTVPDVPPDRHNRFYTALLQRIRATPDVEAAGAVFLRPLELTGIGTDATITLEGQRTELEFREWEKNPPVNFESVTPGYFRAIGTRIVRGRAFSDADTERAPRVAIVSERLARRLWPGQDAIGRRILAPGAAEDTTLEQRWSTIVGVVQDARYRGLVDPRFDLYVAYLQTPGLLVKHLMVRTSGDRRYLVDTIRAEARQLESTALVENVLMMDDLVGRAVAPWRFGVLTLSLLSLLALGIASLGIFAIVSQSVVERTREIGIRMAVGALPREIVTLILREGLLLTAAGIVVGLVVALGAGRTMTSLLYGVTAADPLTLMGMATLFMIVSIAAMMFPVRRATRVDPLLALRQQ